jgi:hypothetical protein
MARARMGRDGREPGAGRAHSLEIAGAVRTLDDREWQLAGGTGALAAALDRQLASTQLESDPVRIGLTFETLDGHLCRSFELRSSGTAGLGCKVDGEWRIPVTSEAPAHSGAVRQAASPPPAVLQVIEARISGAPIDAVAEERARDADWTGANR